MDTLWAIGLGSASLQASNSTVSGSWTHFTCWGVGGKSGECVNSKTIFFASHPSTLKAYHHPFPGPTWLWLMWLLNVDIYILVASKHQKRILKYIFLRENFKVYNIYALRSHMSYTSECPQCKLVDIEAALLKPGLEQVCGFHVFW